MGNTIDNNIPKQAESSPQGISKEEKPYSICPHCGKTLFPEEKGLTKNNIKKLFSFSWKDIWVWVLIIFILITVQSYRENMSECWKFKANPYDYCASLPPNPLLLNDSINTNWTIRTFNSAPITSK